MEEYMWVGGQFRTVYRLIHSLGGRDCLAFVLVECPSVVGSGRMA
jgi:hypothetical protein